MFDHTSETRVDDRAELMELVQNGADDANIDNPIDIPEGDDDAYGEEKKPAKASTSKRTQGAGKKSARVAAAAVAKAERDASKAATEAQKAAAKITKDAAREAKKVLREQAKGKGKEKGGPVTPPKTVDSMHSEEEDEDALQQAIGASQGMQFTRQFIRV